MSDLVSLVIGLRADVATLQSDLGKANALNAQYAKQATDSWNRAGNAVADSLKDIAGKVAAAFAVDQLVAFGAKAIETADQLDKMSQKVGISVESLSALSAQAKLSNVSTEELQTGLGKLAKNASDAAAGGKQQAAAFQAIGVSLKDSNGNLKSTEQLFGEVAQKFSTYQDSALKTADAQKFFGKSAQELIPLLNQLGAEGFAKAREEAEKYGAVVSTDTAHQASEFSDNIVKLKLETEGFANAVTAQLLPGLNALSGEMVKAGETTNRYGDSATIVADAIKGLVVGLITAKEFLSSDATVTFAFYDAVKTTFTAAGEVVAAFGLATYQELKAAFTLDGSALAAARQSLTSNLTKIGADVSKSFTQIKDAVSGGVGNSIDTVRKSLSALFGTFSNVSAGANTTAGALGHIKPPLIENTDAADKAAKALEQYNKTLLDAATFLARLKGGIDPVTKAQEDWKASIIETEKLAQQIIDTGTKAGHAQEAYGQAVEFARQAVEDDNKVLDENLDKIARQADIVSKIQKEYADQTALIGLTDKEKAIAEAVEKATDEWIKNTQAHIENKQSLAEVQAAATATAGSIYDLTEAAKQQREIAQQWASIWTSAGQSVADTFAKVLVEGGSFMKSLADVAKQVVEQIISYFAKLEIINPIFNATFGTAISGGAGSLLPTLFGAASSSGGGVGVSGGSTVGGGSFDLFSAGQSIWNGFQNGWTTFFGGGGEGAQSMLGSLSGTGDFDFGGSTAGTIGSVAGGAIAGWQIGNQLGGTAGGIAGAAGLGVAAYFIPIVGWIAAAATIINSLTGGGLFGTSGKVQEGSTTLSIGAAGADFANQVSLKGKKPLFGGSKWSTQDIVETPEQQQAAQAFFDSMTKAIGQYAKQFGVKAGDLVSASFQQVFDKNGKLTGETHANIAGYNYDNLTQDQFSQAYAAANELTVLDQFDSKLETTIATFRKSADTLVQIATGLTNAEGYLQAGGDFLAVAGKDTLSAIVTLAEGMQASGETIDQTIARLIQAQQQYDQFVQQFKPAAKYVDDFEQSLSGINSQMLANIKQANALAQAAGAAGASETDLANIHKYAAQQAAQAIAALEASAQSLAFSLGLTTVGSLDEVNSEIAALQGKANQGSSAVHNFGSAITDAASAAKNAVDLLLGDLSPLNDQQKLQYALAHASSTTEEQVLEIGRRLYGSTQQYTALFNMAQHMQFGGAAGTSGGVVSGVAGGSGGLSSADQQRLNQLIAEQQQLQSAATLQQYQTLAQQIAEIASSKGEDWRQVVTDMGINIADFEKGLHMSDQQTGDYISAIQKQTDDFGDNTSSLIAALNALTSALGGTPPADTGGGAGGSASGDPRVTGHGGHSSPYNTGRDQARGFVDYINATQPRSGRQQSARSTARV